ncbi:MAG: hypothetical protein JNL70_23100 [Saprospiraceae bacterium]|nr:hypothetical protein [Saprospiraceae bacterium]
MKEFLLLFRNVSGDNQYITTPKDMLDDMPNWQAWIGGLAQQGKLVDTKPINYGGTVVSNQGFNHQPYKSDNIVVVGYLLCKAEDAEEAMNYAKSCPILKYPNGSVEVRGIAPFEL